MEAPQQEEMKSGGALESFFEPHSGLLVKQTMRGCFQECLGCDAKSEYKIAPFSSSELQGIQVSEAAMTVPDIMYALEESSCCCRVCNPGGRNFQMNLSAGGEPGGAPIMYFDKPLTCPAFFILHTENGAIDCPCCCCLPNLTPMTPQGQPIGSQSKYYCDMCLCVPKFTYHEGGDALYLLKPETCCGGACVACNCCSGKGLVYMPFYFHDPNSQEVIGGKYDDPNTPQIRKVWAGFKKECCSTADTFAVIFPEGASATRKAGLLGMTFLIDFVFFEGHQDNKQHT
ncbi:unnamed protein product [Effrenium voratum]|nr:unnamed protein product [Effrenium voratum]|mmetsp:Transcript_91486/g.218051  ORF Transcript_91486/g.218051 Transcript_91486/m.218051 type:complete len:286 (-) Transcript_91486:53-910(-)